MLYFRRRKPPTMWFRPGLLTLAVAVLVAAGIIGLLEAKLRPVVRELATTQTQNVIVAMLEQAVIQDLAQRQVDYGDLVSIQRDSDGAITALSTDMAQLNLLRGELTATVLAVLDGVNISAIQVPLGSLFDFEPLWARGPTLKARAMTVGTVSAEFESELTSAGVNQTLHRIWLVLDIPMRVLLPGGPVDVPVHTRLQVSETVIVGKVPDTFLSLDGSIKS